MSKVMFCLPRFHTNAAPWVRLLQEEGHSVSVHVQRIGAVEDHRLATPQIIPPARWALWLDRMLPRRGDPDFRMAPPLRAYWRRMNAEAPDVVVVRGITRWFCLVAAAIALLQRRRVVVYDQDDVAPSALSGTSLRRKLSRALGMQNITARAAPREAKGLATARTLPFAAPRCGNTLAREARHRIAQDAGIGRMLMVGKYRARKGHAQLLDALAQLANHRHFTLTICAEEACRADYLRRDALEAKARALGIAERVHFRANCSREEMFELFSAHAIFILPSQDEPAAVSPIEAVWHGAVALMDHQSGTRHYLPGDTAFAFDARSPHSIAEALDPLLASPDLLRERRTACLDHLQELASDHAVRDALRGPVLGHTVPVEGTAPKPVDLHPQSSNCRAT